MEQPPCSKTTSFLTYLQPWDVSPLPDWSSGCRGAPASPELCGAPPPSAFYPPPSPQKRSLGGPIPAGLVVWVSGSCAVSVQHIPATGNSHSPLILLVWNQQWEKSLECPKKHSLVWVAAWVSAFLEPTWPLHLEEAGKGGREGISEPWTLFV